jgi:hypothetical protein
MKCFFTVVFLISISTSFAQYKWGLQVGRYSTSEPANLTFITTKDYTLKTENSMLSNGFNVGVFVRKDLKRVYFQTEFLYSIGTKNYTVSYLNSTNENVTYVNSVFIGALEVPLLLGYKLLDFTHANLHVFGGPKFRVNNGSSYEFTNTRSDCAVVQDVMKPVQLGLEGGVGIDFLLFTLDARYNLIGNTYQTKLNNITICKKPANKFEISLGLKLD